MLSVSIGINGWKLEVVRAGSSAGEFRWLRVVERGSLQDTELSLSSEITQEHLSSMERGRLLAGELDEPHVLRILELEQDAVFPALLDRQRLSA